MALSDAVQKIAPPEHIAIIMDGNGRWAKQRGLPRTAGHKAGAESFRRIANYCRSIGVKYLTVYAFSTENWKRSAEEISGIMLLLIGTFLYTADTGNMDVSGFCFITGIIVFLVGLFIPMQRGDAIVDDTLPQKKCPKCGKEHDFDYPKCPYCDHEY